MGNNTENIICEQAHCILKGMPCFYSDSDGITPDHHYCPQHAMEEGFCGGCGNFYAGSNEFDFKHPGYCDNCYSEIELAEREEDEDTTWFNIHDPY